MCDTLFAPFQSTEQGVALFGKNSDRQRNEAQSVEHVGRAEYSLGSTLACTYLGIPQVSRTYAVLLCRPFWMWGAEMGANEKGVVIGNEALHARVPAPKPDALTGMDLVRLGLERAATAEEGVDVITSLLARYGQGGNCGHLSPAYYQNGFLVADATEAFVLETVGREWVLERIRGARAMSNRYSIGRDVDRASDQLPAVLRRLGWTTGEPDIAEILANPEREHLGNAGLRRARSTALLLARENTLTVKDIMRILRDHGAEDPCALPWTPDRAATRTLCMHAGPEGRAGQTVGSLVSELQRPHAVHWVTATAAPCISIFKPIFSDLGVPPHGPLPSARFQRNVLWWRHELLHRRVIQSGFAEFVESIRAERDHLEAQFREQVSEAISADASAEDRWQLVCRCWADAVALEERWRATVSTPQVEPALAPYVDSWKEMNTLAQVEFEY